MEEQTILDCVVRKTLMHFFNEIVLYIVLHNVKKAFQHRDISKSDTEKQ